MVKIEIMLPDELPAEVFAGLCEVMQVGAGVSRARGAIAERVEFIPGEFIDAASQL